MNKKALIIGSTGLVGSALIQNLVQANHIDTITALTRKPIDYSSEKIHNIVIDFNHLEDYQKLFTADYFFSCLGTTRRQAGSLKAQRVVDVDYQLQAAKLALNGNVKHYLLVSSIGANPMSPNPYLQMKGALEKEVSALSFERISIFRPSLLVGDRKAFRLGESIGAHLFSTLSRVPGLKKFKPTESQTLAQAMVKTTLGSGPSFECITADAIG